MITSQDSTAAMNLGSTRPGGRARSNWKAIYQVICKQRSP